MECRKVLNIIKNTVGAFLIKYWYFILICFILLLSAAFRIEVYFLDRQFWPDEAALAANVVDNNGFLWAFLPLNYFQIAPPLFLILTKIITSFFGASEMAFRFLPFLASLISIPVFYMLSKKFLNTKHAIIFANFLYAINFALIRYSSEFKQYSADILIFMLVLLWLSKLDVKDLTIQSILVLNIVFSLLFFISQPTVFLLFGLIAFTLLKNIKNYKFCLIGILPLAAVILYKIQMPSNVTAYMQQYWADGFISFCTIRQFLTENLNFFFYGIKCLKFLIPFIFIGFLIFLYKTYKMDAKVNKIFIFSLFGVVLASALHLYPALNRMILFLFPFVIIFISSVFDFKMKNVHFGKALTIFIIVFSLLFFILFDAKIICKNRNNIILDCCRGRDLAIILKENFNKDDILIISKFNECFYRYYAFLLNINIDNVIILNPPENRKFVEFLTAQMKIKLNLMIRITGYLFHVILWMLQYQKLFKTLKKPMWSRFYIVCIRHKIPIFIR